MLNATDEDCGAGELVYTALNVARGQFELIGNPGVAVDMFSQAHVDGGQVRFVHDGQRHLRAPGCRLLYGSRGRSRRDGGQSHGMGQPRRRNIVLQAEFDDASFQRYFFVMPDRITLEGEGIYFNQQAASHVLLPRPPDPFEIPGAYINRSNQQLFDAFGVSFGGAFLPSDARKDSRVVNGKVGRPAPAATVFPRLFDMTGEGFTPAPPKGGPTPEITGNRLVISNGETITIMVTNLNTTDTNTGVAQRTYVVSAVTNGHFAHRDAPANPITSFTQAQVNGGEIRFVHDGSGNAPSYRSTVSDGSTVTPAALADGVFN